MMVLVAHLRLAGFFGLVTRLAVARAGHPALLLCAVVAVSGGLSAVLVNDAVCVAVTPLVIALARALRRDPLPHLLAVAMAANVGSVATLTGNPSGRRSLTTNGRRCWMPSRARPSCVCVVRRTPKTIIRLLTH